MKSPLLFSVPLLLALLIIAPTIWSQSRPRPNQPFTSPYNIPVVDPRPSPFHVPVPGPVTPRPSPFHVPVPGPITPRPSPFHVPVPGPITQRPSPYPIPVPYNIPVPGPITQRPYPGPGPTHYPHHQEHSHPPLVHNVYPHSYPEVIWNCKINRQPCDLKNGVNFIPFEPRVSPGSGETMFADLGKAAQILDGRLPQPQPKVVFHASRLWTKNYFPARYTNACMHLSYAWSGKHYKKIYIMQRNGDDECIYSAETQGSYQVGVSAWQDVQIQLDLKFGDARYVMDFEYDLPGGDYREMGNVEIRNFTIAYGRCQRNDGNNCDSPHHISSA